MLKVGCIQYINALPLSMPLKSNSELQCTLSIPSALNRALKCKELDIALTSCVEWLDQDYARLADFAIAAKEKILSVNLYTQFPLQQLDQKQIGLTHHSATSISLLKVLCHHFWKIKPQFVPLERDQPFSDYSALLLIGDEALEKPTIPGFQTIDLAQAWYEYTQLPFVFALFSYRKEIPTKQLKLFQSYLAQALIWSDSHQEQIEQAATQQCNAPIERIREYYTLCNYTLGSKEIESLNLFKKLRKNVPKIFS